MFSDVEHFEQRLAKFFNSPYAVATDCCTHAIELSLRYTGDDNIICPNHTYLSVPMTLMKLNLNWSFQESNWENYYWLGNTNIVDAAAYHYGTSYLPGTFMCISFQFKKPINLGRGGAILCESKEDWLCLKKMSYDGRYGDEPWKEQEIDSIGYHYYMTPETAYAGIEKLQTFSPSSINKSWSWNDFPDLSNYKVFNV